MEIPRVWQAVSMGKAGVKQATHRILFNKSASGIFGAILAISKVPKHFYCTKMVW